jgi:MFS transporter
VAAVFFLNGFVLAVWAARVPEVAARARVGPGALSLALLSLAAGALAAFQVSAVLTARAGSAAATRVFAVIFCAGLAGPAMASSLPGLAAALVVFGAGNGGLDIAMNAQGLVVEQQARRPLLSGFHAAFSAGGLAGAGTAAALAAAGAGTRAGFLGVASSSLLLMLLSGRHLLADPPRPGLPPAARRRLRIPSPALAALGVIAFCSAVGEGSMADWSAVYLRDDLAATAAVASLGYAAFSLGMLAGRLTGDRLRIRHRSAGIIAVSAALAAAGLGTGLTVGQAGAVIAGYAAVGIGLALVAPLVFAAVTRQEAQAVGDALASVATMGYAGFLCGPALIGLIARAGNLRSGLYLVVGLCALAAAAARHNALLRSA